MARYQALTHTHIFAPVSVEISGACGPEAKIIFCKFKFILFLVQSYCYCYYYKSFYVCSLYYLLTCLLV